MATVTTLAVHDPSASACWYQEHLGFRVVHEVPGLNGTPVAVHVRRARHQDVVLARRQTPTAAGAVTLTFWVHDLDALASAMGAAANDELAIRDPDGYELVFCRAAS